MWPQSRPDKDLKTIRNKTPKPLSVPLPDGKRLFLSPGKTGQIATRAADHAPLLVLVESGKIEIVDADGNFGSREGNTGSSIATGQDRSHTKALFRRGDV